MSSLLRSCIQDCVQEVPVGQMAQGTPPRLPQVASTGFINFSMAFFYQFRHELFIVLIEPQVLQASNCPSLKTGSKGDFPMALLPDPTASERSPVKKNSQGPVKKRLCGNLHVPSSVY